MIALTMQDADMPVAALLNINKARISSDYDYTFALEQSVLMSALST